MVEIDRVDIENFRLGSPGLEGKVLESEIMMRTRERILQMVMKNLRRFIPIKPKKMEAMIAEELAEDYRRLAEINAAWTEETDAALSEDEVAAYELRINRNINHARSYKQNLQMFF